MNKKILVTAILLIAAAIGGGYFYFTAVATESEEANIAPASGQAAMAPAVSTLDVEHKTISLTRSLPGRVSAFRQSQVRPQVNGIITERLFEEGANVEQGQQLYQIDDARYKAALASAEADLKSAKSKIASIEARANRYENLVKIDAVSQQEYDDVKAELDQAKASVSVAEAAVDVAQVNLDYTKVYAPIGGRIGRSLVTEGALVTANQEQPLAVITQLDPIYVDMQQASVESIALQQARLDGQEDIPVTLKLGENDQLAYPHEGRLKFSEVTIDEMTGSITLRAVVPNPEGVLMPGLFVRANLVMGEKEALLVPQRAATRNPQGNLNVWVVGEDNIAQLRTIEVGQAYKDQWIVLDGLQSDEKIIIEGYQKIAPGTQVTTSPWQNGQAHAPSEAAQE